MDGKKSLKGVQESSGFHPGRIYLSVDGAKSQKWQGNLPSAKEQFKSRCRGQRKVSKWSPARQNFSQSRWSNLSQARNSNLSHPRNSNLDQPRNNHLDLPRNNNLDQPRNSNLSQPRNNHLSQPRNNHLDLPRNNNIQTKKLPVAPILSELPGSFCAFRIVLLKFRGTDQASSPQ